MIKTVLICLLAGTAAGVGTGFSGLSAVTVIAPMLISFLDCPWYEAVGIGLASDVLASAFSALVYRKNGNIDLKNGKYMAAVVLVMAVAGSYFSQYLPDRQMGWFSVLSSIYMGIRFVARPAKSVSLEIFTGTDRRRRIVSILCGCWIGFYCGFMGAGGGLMMLFILTHILGYELKTAVGTSVFVMTFTAFTGAASHFYFGDITGYIPALALCALFTLVAAVLSSSLANRMTEVAANRATGITLLVLGAGMLAETILGII